jgi:Tat protein secretion system quality control protein TatD with DNase activity
MDKAKHNPEHLVKSRNEPCCTRQVLEVIAALHQIEIEEAARIIYENTVKMFPQQ